MKKNYFSACQFVILAIFVCFGAYAAGHGVVVANFETEEDSLKYCNINNQDYSDVEPEQGDECVLFSRLSCQEDFYCHMLVEFDAGYFKRIIRIYGDGYTRSGNAETIGLKVDSESNPLGRPYGYYQVEYNIDYYREIASSSLRRMPNEEYVISIQSANFGRLSMINFDYEDGFLDVLGLYDRLSKDDKEIRCIPENGVLRVSLDDLINQDESGNSFFEYVYDRLCGFNGNDFEQIKENYINVEKVRPAQSLVPDMEGYASQVLPVYHDGQIIHYSSYLVDDTEEHGSVILNLYENPRIVCYENCEPYTELTGRRSYPRDLDTYFRDVNRQAVLSTADVRAMLLVVPVSTANVLYYNNIGYYLEQSGQYDESILLLNKVLETFPNRTVAYINLGDAYWGLDKHVEARKAYQNYIRLMRENDRKQRIPQRIFERVGDGG